MAKIDGVQEISIDLLKPYENNAKIHGAEQVSQIAESIKEFGFISPCLIDRDYNIIAGHGRLMAAQKLGMEKVPCVFVEGLTETQRKAYILADNRLTELGEWDTVMVSEELSKLKDDGFDIDLTGFDIDDILFTDEEEYYEVPEEYEEKTDNRTQRGELWQLGRHRLLIGDSTKAEDVERLCDGKLADLLETDPPYNVDLGSLTRAKNGMGYKYGNTDDIQNDAMDDEEFVEFLESVFRNASNVMKYGAPFYVWFGMSKVMEVMTALMHTDLTVHQTLIWIKQQMTLSMSDYKHRYEPCLYGWKEGAAHYFIDLHSQDTVFNTPNINALSHEELIDKYKDLSSYTDGVNEDRPTVSKDHPTMKPVPLIKKQIRNSSREGEVVLDLFGGSGTTLLACEQLNRTCWIMEYDPKYADVIIRRWEEETGLKAERIGE